MSYGIGLVTADLASRFVANEELTQAKRSRLFPGDDFKIYLGYTSDSPGCCFCNLDR
jgi:hypothetical protein